jgi:hypothetical protein
VSLLSLIDQLDSLLVALADTVCLYPSTVDSAPPTLGVVWVEHLYELVAGKLTARATVLRIMLLCEGVSRVSPSEWLAFDLRATRAVWLLSTCMSFT